MRESIMTGKTVEEATQLALAELGIEEEEATVEVLELPQKNCSAPFPPKCVFGWTSRNRPGNA